MTSSIRRWWWWGNGGKDREPATKGSSLHTSNEWGLGLRENNDPILSSISGNKVRSSSKKGTSGIKIFSSSSKVNSGSKMGSLSSKVKRKWLGREKRMIDKEYDLVLVPSDGVCLSDSESDDSDWSIGWSEPLGPDFQSDGDESSDNSFAVLVRCYSHDYRELVEGQNNQLLNALKSLPNGFSSEGNNSIEQWPASLQNSSTATYSIGPLPNY